MEWRSVHCPNQGWATPIFENKTQLDEKCTKKWETRQISRQEMGKKWETSRNWRQEMGENGKRDERKNIILQIKNKKGRGKP